MTDTIETAKPARHMMPWGDDEKAALWRLAGLEGKDFDNVVNTIASTSMRNPSAVMDAYYRFVHADAQTVASAPTHYLVRLVIDRLGKDAPKF